MRILVFIFLFLFLGAMFVVTENSLALVEKESRSNFFGLYEEWIENFVVNVKTITGDVVGLEWFPSGP
tara:strand:- start:579 stop:782 length:204 start_codon:yes stop_codon:yes gene_type:complete